MVKLKNEEAQGTRNLQMYSVGHYNYDYEFKTTSHLLPTFISPFNFWFTRFHVSQESGFPMD